jgi:hypothetical protein
VDMWSGGMMTVFSRFKAGWDGSGYGPMLSVAVVSGQDWAPFLPSVHMTTCKLILLVP